MELGTHRKPSPFQSLATDLKPIRRDYILGEGSHLHRHAWNLVICGYSEQFGKDLVRRNPLCEHGPHNTSHNWCSHGRTG